MPISVVVGGQYGSEGKGKVALYLARNLCAGAVVRVGGPNSGHTGIDESGKAFILRQLPASSLFSDALVVIPAGSLIDPDILIYEIEMTGIDKNRLMIDGKASIITPSHKDAEAVGGLTNRIGSTGSGTGACLSERIARVPTHQLASEHHEIKKYVHPDTVELLRSILKKMDELL